MRLPSGLKVMRTSDFGVETWSGSHSCAGLISSRAQANGAARPDLICMAARLTQRPPSARHCCSSRCASSADRAFTPMRMAPSRTAVSYSRTRSCGMPQSFSAPMRPPATPTAPGSRQCDRDRSGEHQARNQHRCSDGGEDRSDRAERAAGRSAQVRALRRASPRSRRHCCSGWGGAHRTAAGRASRPRSRD